MKQLCEWKQKLNSSENQYLTQNFSNTHSNIFTAPRKIIFKNYYFDQLLTTSAGKICKNLFVPFYNLPTLIWHTHLFRYLKNIYKYREIKHYTRICKLPFIFSMEWFCCISVTDGSFFIALNVTDDSASFWIIFSVL